MKKPLNKILLIDKPKGITSYDVIRKIKKKYPKDTKIGHAGTLDPNASGLMIVGVGTGTKELKNYIGLDKTYVAEVLLGMQTDSGDLTGRPVRKIQMTNIKVQKENIENVLKGLVGQVRLPVSKFSAKKVSGEALYKKARRGEEVPTVLQDMDVHLAQLLDHYSEDDHYILKIEFEVSSGTYVRSIAEEIGRRLGVPTTLKNLRRTKIGAFSVENAQKLSDLDI